MGSLRFILSDQITCSIAALVDVDPAQDLVLMVEVADETTYVRHHKHKIAFYQVPEGVTREGFSARGGSDSRWRPREVRHAGSAPD
jgi:deoxyribodipyrimidine photolyase-like uncharacterized protein